MQRDFHHGLLGARGAFQPSPRGGRVGRAGPHVRIAVGRASRPRSVPRFHCQQRADGHGGRCLRHARLLRDSQHPRHDRRRAAGEDSQAVPTQPAVERSRWDDQKDQEDWASSMEEGGRLSSTGPRRERVLPVQVDSRRFDFEVGLAQRKLSNRCLRATCSIE